MPSPWFVWDSLWGCSPCTLPCTSIHLRRATMRNPLFAGGLTNTPALAAALQLAQKLGLNVSNVSVGYGIAYPFSVVSVVLISNWGSPALCVRPQMAMWARELGIVEQERRRRCCLS